MLKVTDKVVLIQERTVEQNSYMGLVVKSWNK